MPTSRSLANKKRKIDIEESSQPINTSKSYTNMKKQRNTTNQTEINTCYIIKLSPDAEKNIQSPSFTENHHKIPF